MTYGHDRLRLPPGSAAPTAPERLWRSLGPDHRLALVERLLDPRGLAA